jgi:hypothetical protein
MRENQEELSLFVSEPPSLSQVVVAPSRQPNRHWANRPDHNVNANAQVQRLFRELKVTP